MSNVNTANNNKFNVKDFETIKKEIKNFFKDKKEFKQKSWGECYKKLALKYHPDKQSGKTDDDEKVKLLNSLNEFIKGKFANSANEQLTIRVLDEACNEVLTNKIKKNLERLEIFNESLKNIIESNDDSIFVNIENKIRNLVNNLTKKNEINKEFDEVFYFWRRAFFDFKILDDFSQGKQNFLDKKILSFIYIIFEIENNYQRNKIIDYLISDNNINYNSIKEDSVLFPVEINSLKELLSNPSFFYLLGITKESILKRILLKFTIFLEREKFIEFEGSKLLLKLIRQNLIKNKEIKFVDSSQKDNLIKNLKELNKKYEISIFKKIKLKLFDSSEISDQASIKSKKIKFIFIISYVTSILFFTTAFYFGINISLLIKFALKKIPIDVLKKNLKIFLILLLCLIFINFINYLINFTLYDKFQYEQKHDQIVSNSVRGYLVNEKDDNKKFAAEFFLASLENGEFYFEPEKIQEFLKMFLTEEQIQQFHEDLKQVSDENFVETIKDEKTALMNFIQEFFEKNILLEKPKTKISEVKGPILAITLPDWQKEMYPN